MAEPVPQTALELRNWLRGLKEQSGASYDDIARGIGEDSRVVKRWMTGEKPSVPRGDSLLRLLDYLGGRVHTNGLENFWSLLKRGLNGTYVSVQPSHLFRYLDERCFTYNERHTDDLGRFELVLQAIAGKRLTYAELTGR